MIKFIWFAKLLYKNIIQIMNGFYHLRFSRFIPSFLYNLLIFQHIDLMWNY